jgi:opacity protein-like surface antigen
VNRRLTRIVTGTVVAGVVSVSGAVSAQEPTEQQATPKVPSLVISGTILQGYDDDLLVASGLAARPNETSRSIYTGASAFGSYRHLGKNIGLTLNGRSGVRYDDDHRAFLNSEHYGSAAFSAKISRTSTVTLSQDLAVTSSSLYRVFPLADNAIEAAPLLFAPTTLGTLGTQRTISETSAAGFSRTVSRRGSIEVHSSLMHSALEESSAQDLTSYSVGGGYRTVLTRNMGLHLGYTYNRGRYAIPTATTGVVGMKRLTVHDIDIGLDYQKALSRSRRTFLAFSGGSAVMQGASDDQPSEYSATGQVTLTHQLNRTWKGQLAYERGLRFFDGFGVPVLSDRVFSTWGGRLSRRTSLSMSGGVAIGKVNPTEAATRFHTYTADTTFQYSPKPSWGVFVSYDFQSYQFGQAEPFLGTMPNNLDRYGIRVGLTFTPPLL